MKLRAVLTNAVTLMILLSSNPAGAETISHAEAMSKAYAAITRHQSDSRRVPSSSLLKLSYDAGSYYIFNSEGGGWAVVAADNRVPQAVLAYSPSGSFDIDNVPATVRRLLDSYADEIDALDTREYVIAPKRASGRSVAPLLGETAWAQGDPFNRMCPVIDGQRCVTGCVNTAISQIMYHHRHPAVGRGSHSYQYGEGTLSADFSQSVYQWDLMKPVYYSNDSEESKDAVALLMRDCGIANSSNYGTWETGASLNLAGLVEYFGYDKSVRSLDRNNCTREYYEETMRSELDAGRPVEYEGGSPNGGHAFVCDGYDSEGYFHFNFGWGPGSTGYYLTSATGFDSSPGIHYSIMPDVGNPPAVTAGSSEDFSWENGDRISCSIYCQVACGEPSTIEVGLEVCDKATDEVSYLIKYTYPNMSGVYIGEFFFDDAVADGDYRLRAVCRVNGGEWVRATFGDMRVSYVDVNVSGGIKTYTDEVIEDDMDPGVVRIDGVYYRLDGDRAVVTSRNARKASYSGNVIIPDKVNYQGRTMIVDEIGESSFSESQVSSVVVGRNVKTIAFGSFDFTTIGSLIFEQPSALREIGGWGFNACNIDVVELPEGLESIATCTFQSSSMTKLKLPSSLRFISNSAFNYSTQLRDVYVRWNDVASLPTLGNSVFEGCEKSQINLHVPVGSASIYAAAPQWSELNIIEDADSGIDEIAGDRLEIMVANGRIVITGLPVGTVATVYDISGMAVATTVDGEVDGLNHGVYIVKAGSTVAKVVL